MRTTSITPLALTLAVAGCGAGSGGADAVPGPAWNVLLVTLDTTRPDWLGCYGGTAQTPHIDRVASEGARFERCQATAGITPMTFRFHLIL